MPSPFPGMNPYLEAPALWSGVHHWLITEIARSLAPQLRPRYFVAGEERVYQVSGEGGTLVGIPDTLVLTTQPQPPTRPPTPIAVTLPMPTTIREGYLEIRTVGSETVVTVIEVLSPANKRTGEGRNQFLAKRQTCLSSASHWVEIDLLRAGEPMPLLYTSAIQSHYRLLISRCDRRPQAELYAFDLPTPIPPMPLPLQPGDPEPILDLQAILHRIYDQGGYDLRLDYQQPAIAPLTPADAAWVEAQLRQQGLRS